MALPNDHPSNKKHQSSEKIQAPEIADFAERFDPVPEAVVNAARDAFRSRPGHHPEAQQVSVDSDTEREAATNNNTS
jgi:hypothetical protein